MSNFLFSSFFFSFLSGLLKGSKFAYKGMPRLVSFRGYKKLEPCPDGLL